MKQNTYTLYGKVMSKIVIGGSKFLMKNMWLYYLLNYTWGILTTIGGYVIYGFVLIFMHKKIIENSIFGPCRYLMFGYNWGGLECGVNFLLADKMGKPNTLHTKQHELGHTFQNAILGPFALFLSFIPSVIRYWYQHFRFKKDLKNKPYDSIWFEGSATEIGEIYYKECMNGN